MASKNNDNMERNNKKKIKPKFSLLDTNVESGDVISAKPKTKKLLRKTPLKKIQKQEQEQEEQRQEQEQIPEELEAEAQIAEIGTKDDVDWAISLINFLSNLAPIKKLKFQGFEDLYNFMITDPKAQAVWIRGFTHQSFDPNVDSNYEILEFLGDKILKHIFTVYLYDTFPGYDQHYLTQMENHYMSAPEQTKMTQHLGLDRFIRVSDFGSRVFDVKITGDLFESFIGSIYTVANLYKSGIGIFIAKKVLFNMMENYEIDEDIRYGSSAHQQITNIFGKLYSYNKNTNRYYRLDFPPGSLPIKKDNYLIIELNEHQLDYLKRHNKNVPRVLAKIKERKLDKYELNAFFKEALNVLNSHGIDTPWSIKMQHKADFERIDIIPTINKARERRNKEGYIDWKFKTIAKLGNTQQLIEMGLTNYEVLQLIGIAPNGRQYILEQELVKSARGGGYGMESKANLLKKYAAGPSTATATTIE